MLRMVLVLMFGPVAASAQADCIYLADQSLPVDGARAEAPHL
jgi:hypothetical protein